MSIVTIENVYKRFGENEVLKGVSLEVERGQVLALLGRSGSGKSTLLRCLNGLEKIDSGRIEIAGHAMSYESSQLRALREDVGIVFQSYNLFPHLPVAQNIMLAPGLVKRVDKAANRALAERVLDRIGLLDKIDDYPDSLSGGQQQRVAIARALAMEPRVMLFDEVTSALDPELTEEVLEVIEQLARDGMTMLLVTHEMNFARRVANTIVFMNEGRIWEMGDPETMFTSPKTAEFEAFTKRNVK